MVMKGYANLPTETAAALTADGYFRTGDLGHVDEDKFLSSPGAESLIIVAGEKAVPREIEDVLINNPALLKQQW